MKYQVVIVDDHTLIAKAIASVVDGFDNYIVLYEAEHGKAMIEQFKNPKNIPDIVLLDISMPEMDGFETAKWLKTHHPQVLILTLSMQNDDISLIRMVKSGAKGYLLKNIHPEELKIALDALTTKGFYYPEWAADKVMLSHAKKQKNSPKLDIMGFTERENAFLQYCCSELSYKEIAEKLSCSARTVEGYRDILFEKIGVKTRIGLALYAIKSGKIKI